MKIKSFKHYLQRHRWLKWFTIGIGCFLLLLCIGYGIVFMNKGKIEAHIRQSLNDQIRGQVSIGEIHITLIDHFPRFSIALHNVTISDENMPAGARRVFDAKAVYIQIHLLPLLHKRIDFRALTVNNANLNLVRFAGGAMNTAGLINEDADTTSAADIDDFLLSRIYLKQVNVRYRDELTGKAYDFTYKESTIRISNFDSISVIHAEDRIYVAGLLFKPERGPCLAHKTLKTDLKIDWDRNLSTFTFRDAAITIDKNTLQLTGVVRSRAPTTIDLWVQSNGIHMASALSWVSQFARDKLEGYDFTKALKAVLHVQGAVDRIEPLNIDLNFSTNGNIFKMPTRAFEAVDLQGHYFNHFADTAYNDLSNCALRFSAFKGTYEGIPFNMDLFVSNMIDPTVDMHVKCDVALQKVNGALDTSSIEFSSGNLLLRAEFRGKMNGYTEKMKDSMTAVMYGTATISNGACRLPRKSYSITKMNATVAFNEKEMRVNDLTLSVNNNPLVIQVVVSNFVNALVFPTAKVNAVANVTCREFDLDQFKKPLMVQSVVKTKSRIAGVVSDVLNNLEGSLTVNVGSIRYHKFLLSDVKGKVILSNSNIACENLSMHAAKGDLRLDGRLSGIGTKAPAMDLTAHIQGADITALFYQLDNFHQQAVTSENIQGKVDATAHLNAGFDRQFKIDPLSMAGDLKCTVSNGALINMVSLNEISKNIFKKKDFSNIQFAQLINTTSISGRELHIQNMEIQSNVLSLFVDGIYSFGDSTELFIRVPVKSLKVQDDDYIAENNATDDKIGMSIHLKATKVDGKLKVTPQLFHKNSP